MHRHTRKTSLSALVAAAAIAWLADGDELPRPNVLLVTVDTCRADRLGCYGYGLARTPAIDALASEGVRCTNAVTTAPITLVAHASIMTGLLPPAHGVRDNGAYTLADDYQTLAEILKQNGYATAAFVSAVVLSRRYNLSQGFDTYDDDLWAEDEPRLFMIRDRPAPRTAERAVRWLRDRAAKSNAPFFLWVHFFDPHQPYESRYPDRHLLPTAYDAEIAQADEGVHAIVDFLRASNTLDSTVVILTADHGEGLGEHGEKTHAIFVYDTTVRVPLVVRYPPLLPKGNAYDGPVRCTDIYPSVLAAAGIEDVPANQGVNLLPAFRGETPPPQLPQYSESLLSEVGFGMAPLFAVRHNGKKFIRAPKPELYDLNADPRELTNTYRGPTDETKELDALLQNALEDSAHFAKAVPSNPLDAETLETLRALGYVATEAQRPPTAGMDPKDGMALYNKLEDARHAAQRRDYPSSEKLLREILAAAPSHVTARNVLGLVLTRMGKFDDAAREYLASLDTDPSQARVLHMLGVLSVREKKYGEAETYCRQALQLSPSLVESMAILGFLALQKGNSGEAERWYKQALDADPTAPRALLAYADLFFLRDRYAEALTFYRKVLDALPDHFGALLQAGICTQRLNKFDDAAIYFQRANSLRTDSWVPYYDLACVNAQQHKLDIAIGQLKEAAQHQTDDTNLVETMRRDPDLKALRADARWDALLRDIQTK